MNQVKVLQNTKIGESDLKIVHETREAKTVTKNFAPNIVSIQLLIDRYVRIGGVNIKCVDVGPGGK